MTGDNRKPRNKLRIKKGDTVVVITGRDKGKTGEVFEVMPAELRVRVRGVNMVKRHTRASAASAGGIVEKEAPIHVSNVAHVDPETKRPTRVGYRFEGEGEARRKVRVAKRSGAVIGA